MPATAKTARIVIRATRDFQLLGQGLCLSRISLPTFWRIWKNSIPTEVCKQTDQVHNGLEGTICGP